LEDALKTVLLLLVTAVAELIGCYLPYLWLRKDASPWLLVLSLAVFAWLLTLHPTASGRVYAAYGGVYVAMAVLWLWAIDGVRPTRWDLLGAVVTLIGMAIIMFAPRPAEGAKTPSEARQRTGAASSVSQGPSPPSGPMLALALCPARGDGEFAVFGHSSTRSGTTDLPSTKGRWPVRVSKFRAIAWVTA